MFIFYSEFITNTDLQQLYWIFKSFFSSWVFTRKKNASYVNSLFNCQNSFFPSDNTIKDVCDISPIFRPYRVGAIDQIIDLSFQEENLRQLVISLFCLWLMNLIGWFISMRSRNEGLNPPGGSDQPGAEMEDLTPGGLRPIRSREGGLNPLGSGGLRPIRSRDGGFNPLWGSVQSPDTLRPK